MLIKTIIHKILKNSETLHLIFKTLSDSKKRQDYDRYGESGPPKYYEQQFEFFQDTGFMFFSRMPHESRHQDLITLNFYKKTILPESYKKLYLLQIVSDWCMKCEYKSSSKTLPGS